MSVPTGGARPGAGRKPNAEIYAGPLARASDALAAALPEAAEALITLAFGLKPRIRYVAAGTVTRKDVLRRPRLPIAVDEDGDTIEDDGIWLDPKGKPIVVDVPVFPHLDPGKLVKVEEIPGLPDYRALAMIFDRLGGKPNLEPVPEEETLDIREALAEALKRAAERKARGPVSNERPPEPAPSGPEGDDDEFD